MLKLQQNIITCLLEDVHRSMRQQDLRVSSSTYGAYISSQSWTDEAGHVGTTLLLAQIGFLLLAYERDLTQHVNIRDIDELLHRMQLATGYLLRVQRPSGLIDLRSTNYDSGPDTGFAVQLIGAFLEQVRASGSTLFASLLPALEDFCRKALHGLLTGGFHTPNHRWVVTGALMLGHKLFPEVEVASVVEAYIVEGIDIDEDGTYLERSIAVYDAVTNRSLAFYADNIGQESEKSRIYAIISRNLMLNLHMLHPDGTAETALSSRHDHGVRNVPTTLIAPYLHVGIVQDSQDFIAAAAYLWDCGQAEGHIEDAVWVAYFLLRHGDIPATSPAVPDFYVRYLPHNRIWRKRDRETSISLHGEGSHLLHFIYRQAELLSLQIAQAYFSVGLFLPDSMEVTDESITLLSSGLQKPNLPAYHLPLGRPVARSEFDASIQARQQKAILPARSELQVKPFEDGLLMKYTSLDGLDQVITQISLDFPAGGLWETDDTVVACQPGTTLFLKKGYGRMRYGVDAIEIGPGHVNHLDRNMRHSLRPSGSAVRVLLTFTTPVEHTFYIRGIGLLSSA